MADKEERILITKVSPNCHALRFSCYPFDTEECMFCAKSDRYVRITEKDCAKCKNPVLIGISRDEAVERMAKVLYEEMFKGIVAWEKIEEKSRWRIYAEAALNALL